KGSSRPTRAPWIGLDTVRRMYTEAAALTSAAAFARRPRESQQAESLGAGQNLARGSLDGREHGRANPHPVADLSPDHEARMILPRLRQLVDARQRVHEHAVRSDQQAIVAAQHVGVVGSELALARAG